MSYAICPLCRAKVPCSDQGAYPERCPQCQGKLPRDLELSVSQNDSADNWLCPSCLGAINKMTCNSGNCPICGRPVDGSVAAELGKHVVQVTREPLQALLQGASASAVAQRLQDLGIDYEQAWRCVDRHLAELPFERYKQEQQGSPSQLAPSCDSCGLSEELALYEARWELNPAEMKHYSKGYAGFEGSFSDSRNYTRYAVYC